MKTKAPDRLILPFTGEPELFIAGRFLMEPQSLEVNYYSPFTQVLHLHEYEGTLRMGTKDYPLSPGDITLTPQKTDNCYRLEKPGHHLCIHFILPPRRGKLFSLPLHVSPGPRRGFIAERMLHSIRLFAMSKEKHPQASWAKACASASLRELLLWMGLEFQKENQPSRQEVRSEQVLVLAVQRLQERMSEPVQVPVLSKELGLTQNYLAKLFHQRYGMTMPHYLLTLRIERARELLLMTDLPIHKIGLQVGIPDPQYFNKLFRRLTGYSPSQVRKEYKK